jgi:hypothetical protein
MSIVVVISQHLLNVFVQLANKRGFKKKNLKNIEVPDPPPQIKITINIEQNIKLL